MRRTISLSLLTPRDLAEMLQVSVGHIYSLIRERRVPVVKFRGARGAVRFRRESIERWIVEQEINTVAQALSRRPR
jgi:excisionase family DNA binding protein